MFTELAKDKGIRYKLWGFLLLDSPYFKSRSVQE